MPWFTILRHAPAILAAADTLLKRAKTSRADDHTQNLEARLDDLAESSRASAELLQDMAKQLQAMAAIHAATDRKARLALGMSVAALVIAVAAGVIAFVR